MFHNKTIIITGASSGLGRALAHALALQKANLALFARNKKALQETAEICKQKGANTYVISGDITKENDCKNLIEQTIAQFGQLDVLINNAGTSMWQKFDESQLDVHRKLIDTNYLGALYCTYYALPYLKQSRGLIVAISSVQGKMGAPYHTGYSGSKHALQGFFSALRTEIEKDVDVLIVSPSWIEGTNLRKSALGKQNIKKSRTKHGVSLRTCVTKIIGAMEKRKQQLMIPAKFNLFIVAQHFFPRLINRIIKKTINKAQRA